MKKIAVSLLSLTFALAAPAFAGEGEKCCTPPQKPLSKAMEQVKKLEGRWEGTDPKDPKNKIVAEYKLTAGGSALVETLFPGQPHEMVSVYHDRGGRLSMTHYCMLGNQPQLTLKNQEAGKLVLEMSGKSGISSAKEPHMHALTITWKDDSTIVQDWVSYENGKKKDTTAFTLTRVKK